MVCTQAKEKRQAKEAQVAKAQMDAARRGGVSWGMAEEAALEEDLENVTEGIACFASFLLLSNDPSAIYFDEKLLYCQQQDVNTTLQECVALSQGSVAAGCSV